MEYSYILYDVTEHTHMYLRVLKRPIKCSPVHFPCIIMCYRKQGYVEILKKISLKDSVAFVIFVFPMDLISHFLYLQRTSRIAKCVIASTASRS